MASESLDSYRRELRNSKPLSYEEESELAKRIHAGDLNARNYLVEANLKFVVAIAGQYSKYGMPIEDIISAGNMGLIHAAERFDETKGFKFISYAVWWIRRYIQKSLAENIRLYRLPQNRMDLIKNMKLLRGKNQGEEPTLDDIASELGKSRSMIEETEFLSRPPISIDKMLDMDNPNTLQDIAALIYSKNQLEECESNETQDQVNGVLETLDEREAEILKLFFGLETGKPESLAEIGKIYDLSRERVRQLKEKALEKLRENPKAMQLLEELHK